MAQLQAWMVALVQSAQRSESLQNLLLLLKVPCLTTCMAA